MTLEGRDFISIFDFSDQEVEAIFTLADEMSQHTRGNLGLADGMIMCTLFYEPSTRTRLSFEAAMQRLGGNVISVADAGSTSVAKGETIADTVRIIESYADLIVLRHPYDGSAKVAADFAHVPVINAGDGTHEHPTQTLLDLYTIRRAKGTLKDLNVALVGDLRYGRTVHSLAFGLARFGAKVTLISPAGLEMPAHLLERLKSEFQCCPAQYGSLTEIVAPPEGRKSGGKQQAWAEEVLSQFEVFYLTRVQKERFASEAHYRQATATYAEIPEALRRARTDALVMHPLPRVAEIPQDFDRDPRAMYFQQAAYGLPIRMALVAATLGRRTTQVRKGKPGGYKPTPKHEVDFRKLSPVQCSNPRCVTHHEPYLTSQFHFLPYAPGLIACAYCEHEAPMPDDVEVKG